MRFRILGPIMLVAMLAACGDSPTGPDRVSINGTWVGSSSGMTVTVTMNEAGGTVSGSGNISATGGSTATQVHGTRAGANLSLTLSAQGYEPTNFTGTIQSNTLITGSLTGSGFNNMAITFNKQ
jgi:hypothetical protein